MSFRALGSMLLALGLSTSAPAADTDSGGCAAPKTAEPTSAVDVPQYAVQEDDDAPDPAAEARVHEIGRAHV